MGRNIIARWAAKGAKTNINGRTVAFGWAALFIPVGLYIAVLAALEAMRWSQWFGNYPLVHFSANKLLPWPWLTDEWFGYVVLGIGVLTLAVCRNVALPPEQRLRASSLRWRNVRCQVRAAVIVVSATSIGHWVTVIAFALFVGSCIVALAADHFGKAGIVQGAAACALTISITWPIVWCGKKEPALFLGAVPSGAVWGIVVVAKVLSSDILGPIPIVFFIFLMVMLVVVPLLVWVLPAWFFLRLARRCKNRLLWGPSTELMALAGLIAPWFLAAFILPREIDANHEMLTISASIGISLIWGKSVTEPFAKLVNALREIPTSGAP